MRTNLVCSSEGCVSTCTGCTAAEDSCGSPCDEGLSCGTTSSCRSGSCVSTCTGAPTASDCGSPATRALVPATNHVCSSGSLRLDLHRCTNCKGQLRSPLQRVHVRTRAHCNSSGVVVRPKGCSGSLHVGQICCGGLCCTGQCTTASWARLLARRGQAACDGTCCTSAGLQAGYWGRVCCCPATGPCPATQPRSIFALA